MTRTEHNKRPPRFWHVFCTIAWGLVYGGFIVGVLSYTVLTLARCAL